MENSKVAEVVSSSKKESVAKPFLNGLNRFLMDLDAIESSFAHYMKLHAILHGTNQAEILKYAHTRADSFEELQEGDVRTVRFKLNKRHIAEYRKLDKRRIELDVSSKLMPRNFVVALLCSYDSYMGKAVGFVLGARPELLKSSERVLNYSDLFSFEDLESAKRSFIEKEVDTVLRRSHLDHLKWIEAKVDVELMKGLKCLPDFIELCERRNLFVHCDGVVSSQYLKTCKDAGCDVKEVLVGTELAATRTYFKSAIVCLSDISIKLTFVLWSKMIPSEGSVLANEITNAIFTLIGHGKYEVATRVLSFAIESKGFKFEDDIKRLNILNLAQAHKWNGSPELCKKVLDAHNWRSVDDKLKLGHSVLMDDFEGAYKLMKKLSHDDDFKKEFYYEWPIFKELRIQQRFAEVYLDCYKEPYEVSKVETLISSLTSDVSSEIEFHI